jgi:Right handed beta helix region
MPLTRNLSVTLLTLAILLPVSAAFGAMRPTVVFPTGVYPDDVTRVQAAVDKGGTVILKSVSAAGAATAFNFGTGISVNESGGVVLNKDVSIEGEVTRYSRTTILGGFLPITSLQPIKTSIQGIDFESPFWTAITIGASTGSVIVDNVFHNIQPVQVRVPSGRIITFAQAIGFSGYDTSGAPAPELISGNLVIAGNNIDGARAVFSNGIQLDSLSADVEITGNTIRNVNDDTTETGSGVLVIRAQANVTILGNTITPGPTTNFGADGIFIGGDSEARYLVLGNFIETQGPFADGIDVTGGDATGTTGTIAAKVTANSIVVNGPNAAGIFLYDLVTKSQIALNLIRGTGINAFGISTYGFDTNIASQNHFTANDIRGFSSNESDLFYDSNAQNNVEIGFCRSVEDFGSGNSSSCATSMPVSAQALAVPSIAANAAAKTSEHLVKQQHLPQSIGRVTIDQAVR